MYKFNENKLKKIKYINIFLRIFIRSEKNYESNIDLKECRSILLIDFDAIGDVVMLIPFLRILRRSAPEAKISMVCRPHAKSVLANQGLVDDFFFCDKRILSSTKTLYTDVKNARKALSEINRSSYDLALEPRGDLRDIFFMHKCKAERKAAYTCTGGEYMLTDPIEPDHSIEHLIDDKMYFLRQLGCDYSETDLIPKIFLSDRDVKDNKEYLINNYLADKYIIGIHPGASKEIKKWKKFPDLLRRLHEHVSNVAFLLFSEEGEDADIRPLIECANHNGMTYRHICGDIPEYIRRMALCDMVVCNDSSAGHIAAALGVNVHVIFGPVLSELARPYSTASISVYECEGLECRPCNQGGCPNAIKCLTEISVDEVYEGIIRMMKE